MATRGDNVKAIFIARYFDAERSYMFECMLTKNTFACSNDGQAQPQATYTYVYLSLYIYRER